VLSLCNVNHFKVVLLQNAEAQRNTYEIKIRQLEKEVSIKEIYSRPGTDLFQIT